MSTLITNIRLWDGIADHASEDAVVLIAGEVIVWAGSRDSLPAEAAGAEVVDGHGGTLLPGLIDAHIHLAMSRGSGATAPLTGALDAAASALDVGITAVRDLGARDHSVIAAAREIAAGRAPGPWLVAAGRPLSVPGGYMPGVAVEVDSPDATRAAVKAEAAAGAGVIKVIASPVPASRDIEVPRSFGPENLAAAVDAAHACGLRLTAHAHSLAGARDAVLAGFDCIEHGYRLDPDTIAEMARRGTWLVPTLVAMEAAQAPWLGPAGADRDAADVRRARERWEAAAEAAVQAHRAGVQMATGTDAVTIVPVTAVRREVALLVEVAGFTPVEALRAATSHAASLLGIESHTGAVRAGLRADLLLVDGDALSDPSALARVMAVWRGGVRRSLVQ
jgi:imidazolonepropionase-like amidohydrolase